MLTESTVAMESWVGESKPKHSLYGIFTYIWLIFVIYEVNLPYMDGMGNGFKCSTWKILDVMHDACDRMWPCRCNLEKNNQSLPCIFNSCKFKKKKSSYQDLSPHHILSVSPPWTTWVSTVFRVPSCRHGALVKPPLLGMKNSVQPPEAHLPRNVVSDTNHTMTGWWLNQPIWKICSSKWASSTNRDENQKIFETTTQMTIPTLWVWGFWDSLAPQFSRKIHHPGIRVDTDFHLPSGCQTCRISCMYPLQDHVEYMHQYWPMQHSCQKSWEGTRHHGTGMRVAASLSSLLRDLFFDVCMWSREKKAATLRAPSASWTRITEEIVKVHSLCTHQICIKNFLKKHW